MKKLTAVRLSHLDHLCEFTDLIYEHIFQCIFIYSHYEDHFVPVHLFYRLVLAISCFFIFIKTERI